MPDSDPARAGHSPAAGDLICPPEALFDPHAIKSALSAEAVGDKTGADARRVAVDALSAMRSAGIAKIHAAFEAAPEDAARTTRTYCYLTDMVVKAAFDFATDVLHPLPNPTEGQRLAVFAVGGYGRAELAPFSDVDLMFLSPYKNTGWGESVIESVLYILWDMKLKVGPATRSLHDCVMLGKADFTIRTSLLEHRFLCGSEALAEALDDTLWNDLFAGTAAEFIEAKLDERANRHKKQGGQRYVVEPNVKEGKGGLRDLQSLFWIAKYIHRVRTTAELVDLNVFTQEEYDGFFAAEQFLWATRCHLHLIAGRLMDQLTFDLQVEVANRLGYRDKGGRRAVEHFMQDYFRHATRVGELTRIFLTALEAAHVKRAPETLPQPKKKKRKLAPGLRLVQNRIAVKSEADFLSKKLNLLRIFEEALRTGYLIHPDVMRLIAANLDLIDKETRENPEAIRIFRDLLLKHGNPERALRRMNELGVLAAFIPEFEPIVAMMQFNMYHHYTVDEHTIQTISVLAQIERGELVEELPVASSILEAGVNRRVIYIALLLHDIGKGRREDHSILGAQIARKVAPRLGLKAKECDTVEWLVRHHLLMSDVAQKRDISDPRTIRNFARAVGSKERLDLLTVLTVCDIRGVGPDTWNNWKAMLIRRLYAETVNALQDGLEALTPASRTSDAKAALRNALTDWPAARLRKELNRHYNPYWLGLQRAQHEMFARLLDGIDADDIRMEITPDADRDATRAGFVIADHPGLFSRLAGALALVGANVVDARTYTSRDGFATAVFWVQDADGSPYEESRLPRLKSTILRTLKGEVTPKTALADRDKIKKREREFRVPTNISFDNDASDIYTVIEVDTRDRPGLLFDLTRTLADANVYIVSAVIATYGEQVVDTFYVKDMFGLKYHNEGKQALLEKKLINAIKQGAKRARA